jgi:hypothetical protein
MMLRPLAVPLACLAVVAACSDDNQPAASIGESESAGSTGGVDEGTTTAEPTTGEPFEPFQARGGISIVRVEANSGVAIPIGLDGKEVLGPERNAYLPKERDTLIRAYVDVPDDWVPREIEARLHLTGGGVDQVLVSKAMVEVDSRDGDLESTFFWGPPAELIQPGLRYSIELWETAPGQEGAAEGAVPPRAPHTGTAIVGVEADAATLRVVVVPVAYKYGDCEAAIDPEQWKTKFADAILQQNPAATLDISWHAPYEVTYDMTSYNGLSQLVSEMSQLRAAEGAAENVYYYGFFDSCGQCIGAGGGVTSGCTVGLAADITGGDKSDAWGRAAAGPLQGNPQDTFVHEIGHTQGRRHIECPGGNSAGNDPSYPYANGNIGVWGFGIRDYRLRHPTTNYDYMSYCGSTWVSDWQWNATYSRIRTLTSWDMAGAPAPAGGGLLIGAIDDGQEVWWSVPGSLAADAPRSATHVVDFVLDGGTVPVAAQVGVRPHGTTVNVVAPLPDGFDQAKLQRLVLRSPDGASEVAPTAVRWLHRPLDIAAP